MRKGTRRTEKKFTKDNAATRLIGTFFGIFIPRPTEPPYRCSRPGSQAPYRDHLHARERARNLFKPGIDRRKHQALILAEGGIEQ